MKSKYTILFDFDSTLITGEGLDMLASLKSSNNSKLLSQIEALTQQGMAGTLGFKDSLIQRINLMQANVLDLERLSQLIISYIAPTLLELKHYFTEFRDDIYIVSGGFTPYILPVINTLGWREDNLFANNFVFDDNHTIIGFDESNPLSNNGGKVAIAKSIQTQKPLLMIGDGVTDWEVKEKNIASKFILYTGVVARENLIEKADLVANNFYEIKQFLDHE